MCVTCGKENGERSTDAIYIFQSIPIFALGTHIMLMGPIYN